MSDEEQAAREAQRQAEQAEADRQSREAGGGEQVSTPERNSSPPACDPSWNK